MASGVKPRVKVPKTAAAGDTITIKTLISHKMESGQRKDDDGNVIPRSIINRFTCDCYRWWYHINISAWRFVRHGYRRDSYARNCRYDCGAGCIWSSD